jgi:hypothetical protein
VAQLDQQRRHDYAAHRQRQRDQRVRRQRGVCCSRGVMSSRPAWPFSDRADSEPARGEPRASSLAVKKFKTSI